MTAAGDYGSSRCTSPAPASRDPDPELNLGQDRPKALSSEVARSAQRSPAASRDHPVLLGVVPETRYLKVFVVRLP